MGFEKVLSNIVGSDGDAPGRCGHHGTQIINVGKLRLVMVRPFSKS